MSVHRLKANYSFTNPKNVQIAKGLEIMNEYDECYECGGVIEPEVVGDFKDWVCQDCGIIIDSDEVVEEQQEYIDDDVEVME